MESKMRTSRLGRWLLSGALVAAGVAAIGGAVAGATNTDKDFNWGTDFNWGSYTPAADTDTETTTDETGREEKEDDFNWG
jgi:hypothetical protein